MRRQSWRAQQANVYRHLHRVTKPRLLMSASMPWPLDMPFGALSFYAQWRVMRAARDAGVKVLIDGQGGDEVFGGYAKFRYAYLASLLRAGHLMTASQEMVGMIRQGDRYVL